MIHIFQDMPGFGIKLRAFPNCINQKRFKAIFCLYF